MCGNWRLFFFFFLLPVQALKTAPRTLCSSLNGARGFVRWARQQSVSLSPIKMICPAPYDCTPPAVSFLRGIALALNYTNLNISSCLFPPLFLSGCRCGVLSGADVEDNTWKFAVFRDEILKVCSKPSPTRRNCCSKPRWPTLDSIK